MRIADIFSGKKRVMTPLGIERMGRVHDVEGLVKVLDHVDHPLRILIIEQLISLSEKNRYDRMIDVGVIGKLMPIFSGGDWMEKKRAAVLLSSFIVHRRMHRVLRHDWTMKALISLLPEEDEELRKNIVFCIYEFCRKNLGHQVVRDGGIPGLVNAMSSEDPDVHYWVLHSLAIIESLGYQESILRTNLLPYLNNDLNSPDADVRSLSGILLDNLYHWRDMNSDQDEEPPSVSGRNGTRGYEEIGVIDGYHRPLIGGVRPGKKNRKILTSSGDRIRDVKDDDIETILELTADRTPPKPAIIQNQDDEGEDDFEIQL